VAEIRNPDERPRVGGRRGVRNGLGGKLRILREDAVWSLLGFKLLIGACRRIWRRGRCGIGIGFGRICLLCSLFEGCVC
jgi:hypothetical protein